MKRIMAFLLTVLLAGLAGCGSISKTEADTKANTKVNTKANTKEDSHVSDADISASADREETGLYTPEDFAGIWTEKYDGNGKIEISESGRDVYAVKISRDTTDGEKHVWTMTAVPAGSGMLQYEDCTHIMPVTGDDGTETRETVYENGTGTITLLSTYELMWQDDMDNAGENAVFIHADENEKADHKNL